MWLRNLYLKLSLLSSPSLSWRLQPLEQELESQRMPQAGAATGGHEPKVTRPRLEAGLRKVGKMGKNLPRQSQISWTVWSQNNVYRKTDRQTDGQPDTERQKIDRKAHGQTVR